MRRYFIHRNTTHKGQQMKKSEFVVICNKFCVPPSVALESDAVVSAIKFVSSYPACMHSDAIAYVEDVMSAEF